MPKGKRRSKPAERKRYEVASSDEDSVNDSASVISATSDIRSVCDDGAANDQEENEIIEQEVFEEKLKEVIDGITQKSSKGRCTCLEGLQKALATKFISEFISERRETLTDCLKFSLKKGKGEERGIAAIVTALLCIQLGPGDDSDAIFADLCPILLTTMNDNSTPSKARAKCATSLALCTFIVGGIEKEMTTTIMNSLESLFSQSYLKGDGSVPNHHSDSTTLHSCCLAAWSLLLTLLNIRDVYAMVSSRLYRLPELLESSDVDLRIVTGETIALFYEIVREYDENFMGEDIDELCYKLKQLATDSHKYRAKKDRKQQRSSFRDILKAIEEKEVPNIQVRFGQEVLELDNWCRKRQYDAFCNILGSGMNLHLAENELLRDIFELGAPLTANGATAMKISKFERHMGNVAAFKARTIARNKVRDKRAVVLG